MKKRTIIILLIVALVVVIGFVFLNQKGYDAGTIMNMTKTNDLSVDCSSITRAFGKQLTVTVYNGGDNTQNSVQVKIMAYDEAGNSVDEKTTTFDRSLAPHGSLTKLVTVPKGTTRCDCVIQNSNPQ